jgi:hypothetical protein
MATIKDGTVPPGSQVVLVVTGARPEAADDQKARVMEVDADARHVLRALGLQS